MANPEIAFDDAEITALLEELEAEQTKMATPGGGPVPAPAPKPVAPPPIVEPTPEPEPEPEPVPVKEPTPEPALVKKAKEVAAAVADVKEAQELTAAAIDAVAAEIEAIKPAPEPDLDPPADVPTTGNAAKLNFYVDVNQFNRDTKLTEATLDQAMMEQAGLRAYYGSQAAQAEAQHARLKVRFDVLEAKLYDEHRKALAAGGEKVTEKMVENAVKLDPRWAKAKNTLVEAETIASINKSLVISLADRRDMMIQLGADRREEFKGGVRILAEQNERDSLAARAKDAFKNGRGVQ